jgi:arylsulfatase A-like enzyme
MSRFFFVILGLIVGLISCKSPKQDSRPNIVYILADDLGYGEVGAYGQTLIETPNIDRLANEGMQFTQHYSGAPVCAPARCILLTGKHGGHAYIRGNDEMSENGDVWNFQAVIDDPKLEGQRPLPEGTTTLGSVLQSAGYKTACVGKWGLGGPLTEGAPNRQGFDFFFGYNCQRQAHTYTPVHLWKNDKKVILNNDLVVPGTKLDSLADINDPASYSKYQQPELATELMIQEALGFIEENKSEPFFLYYASPLPHVPLQAPEKWVKYYQDKLGSEEPYLGQKGYFPNYSPRSTYAAMISHLDEQVGMLVDKLKEEGLYENTIIMFSSDNGPTYAGGADQLFFDSAKPFKSDYGRGKGFVYEGGIRVPFISVWPGRIESGATSEHISAFYDVLPTLADLVGLPISTTQTDGISFLPELLGKEQEDHEYLFWEYPEYGGQQAVRMGKWKAIRKDIKKGNMQIELYNLDEDLFEERNVAEQFPEIIKQIELIFIKEHQTPQVATFIMPALED